MPSWGHELCIAADQCLRSANVWIRMLVVQLVRILLIRDARCRLWRQSPIYIKTMVNMVQ